MTCYRDLVNLDDVHVMFSVLTDSVASRVVKKNLGRAGTVSITVRDENLQTFTRQAKLNPPSSYSDDILDLAIELFKRNYDFKKGIRTLGVSVSDFQSEEGQISMFDDAGYEKKMKLQKAVGVIRDKYGQKSVQKAVTLKDKRLSREDPETTHTVHPQGFKPKD